MGKSRVAVLVCLAACGSSGPAHGTAKMLNGASPGAAQPRRALVAPAPADGFWQVSPNKLTAPITQLHFQEQSGNDVEVDLTDCTVTFDLTQPALAENLECPFEVPAGTYTHLGVAFGPTYDLTIDDATNGFFTDPSAPSKLVTTVPAGGAQAVSVPNPRTMKGPSFTMLAPPLVVNEGDTITLSEMLSGLQSLQIQVQNGQPQFVSNGMTTPGFPDSVSAVGTPAHVAFYVNPALGTPYTFNGSAAMEKDMAVTVLYTSKGAPAFLGWNGNHLSPCNSTIAFVYPAKNNGYLGLEGISGMLGWVGYSDMNGQNVSSMWRMHQVDTKGGTTSLECFVTTTDPMPADDTFTTTTPSFTPSASTSMMLVVN